MSTNNSTTDLKTITRVLLYHDTYADQDKIYNDIYNITNEMEGKGYNLFDLKQNMTAESDDSGYIIDRILITLIFKKD